NGNQTSIATDKGTVSYEYDSLNQLAKETLTDGTVITYEYDAAGNRTKKIETKGSTPTTTNYTYNAGNKLTNVNGQAYTYDQNGNLLNDGEKMYIYNEENQLIEVKDKTGTSLAKFAYDEEGRRTSMMTSTGTTYFHYSGDKVVAETDAKNNIIAEYSWDDQGNPITMTKGGKIYYYHLNGHGDVTALTDENGSVVAEYQYDTWGNILTQTGTMASSNPYRYAGYRFDEGTKLYYLMARFYNSIDGRFITRDTFHGFENDPLSLNQYAYTKNNPVVYIDPDGHAPNRLDKALEAALAGASLVVLQMLKSGKTTQKAIEYIKGKIDKLFKNIKKNYDIKFNSGNNLVIIIDKRVPKGQNGRVFSIDNGPAYYQNKKTGKKEKISGYWHYHLSDGGHYQPDFMAPKDYKIIK
ncbi:MAG TPA: hypothetical protein GXX18_05655, partial [Bacillales bacterium]|nr:hypothetical protein [Bacillales bacterium]